MSGGRWDFVCFQGFSFGSSPVFFVETVVLSSEGR